jgi:uncharacterized protein YbaA (DUF1428 family)
MAYVDGFIAAVPAANKEKYLEHARYSAAIFKEYGALQVVESWQDDVQSGKWTDFFMATKSEPGEEIVFSWIVWPDKTARNAAWEKCMADPRMQPDQAPMPFDGKRMIYGGFETVMEVGG